MAVGNDKFYKPDEALHELILQETIVNLAVDVQTVLQILVDKEVVTREEVNTYRNRVRNSSKYKATIDDIELQKKGFQAAKDDPEAYLRSLFQAKMDGKIK